jgi:hypothetical protein
MTREDRGASSFDELAVGLSNGTLSRGKALRLVGAALVGGTLASLGLGEAGADLCKRNGKACKKNSQCCSNNCSGGTCAACPPGTELCSNGQCASCCENNDCRGCATCQSGTCACPAGTVLVTANGTCAIPCGPGGACDIDLGFSCIGTDQGSFCVLRGGDRGPCPSGSSTECPTGSVCSAGICERSC